MADVFTALLGRVAGQTGGPLTLYTATADKLAVVTSLSIVWGNVTLSDLDAWFQASDGTKLSRISFSGGSSNPQVLGGDHQVYGRWVLEYPDTLACQTASGTADFYASGFLLSLP
jgi:hypothetical protein